MATEFKIKDILQTMYNAMKEVSGNVFTTNRPKIVDEAMEDFIVVSLPVTLYNKTYGKGYGMTTSYARIEIYVKDRNGLEDIAKLDRLTDSAIDKFPISNSFMILSRPRVLMSGEDGYGFHAVTIQASLLTK
jgi:hypothetical protein|nr:MAG TPA: hypothetical protein [Caudoviricetes sp.]